MAGPFSVFVEDGSWLWNSDDTDDIRSAMSLAVRTGFPFPTKESLLGMSGLLRNGGDHLSRHSIAFFMWRWCVKCPATKMPGTPVSKVSSS